MLKDVGRLRTGRGRLLIVRGRDGHGHLTKTLSYFEINHDPLLKMNQDLNCIDKFLLAKPERENARTEPCILIE